MRKSLFFLPLLIVSLFGCDGMGRQCKTKEPCMNDKNCQCWCSVKCGYRKKTSADHPVWVENDPNGKFCYCKQWDMDHYEENCIQHKNVQEPKDAK